jgi:DNA oxidative demethylase
VYADVGAADAVTRNLITGTDIPVPPVPPEIFAFGRSAVAAALEAHPGVFDTPEWEYPERFTAILNYYPSWGSISPHSDNSEPSLKAEPSRAWPVVSLSVGSSAVFTLYPNACRVGGRIEEGDGLDVTLCSGDVLCFGGPARLMRHAVRRIEEVGAGGSSRPLGLRMVSGRLNVTLRQL